MEISMDRGNRSMKRPVKQIAACAGILVLICVFCRFVFFRDYAIYLPADSVSGIYYVRDEMFITVDEPAVLRLEQGAPGKDNRMIRILPEKAGTATVGFRTGNGRELETRLFKVDNFHTVFDLSTGDFTGDEIILAATSVFWLLVSAIMLWNFLQARGQAFYSYTTIYFAGFSIFALVTGLVMSCVTFMHLTDPVSNHIRDALTVINSASTRFLTITAPLIAAFAVALAVSNIELLRHERPRLQNVLGLLTALLLIAGMGIGLFGFARDIPGPEWEARMLSTIRNTYATIFVYFECMLAGSVICGVRATRQKPSPDRDFIIILGCRFREDGTLSPLLRGRADLAASFWQKQKETTGKEAWLIPSGGQGRDETMPEAEAIRRYLVGKGIPEERILPEKRSRNTWENMSFSREIIRNVKEDGKVLFATTNYHVFRSGIWASRAGLRAEGIGSRTRWWFWPNAFMRETAGLLQKRWKQELFLLVVLIGFFTALSMILG